MPLLDHFHAPLSRTHPWRAFHGAWTAAMARLLNAGVLPAGYYAVPFLDREKARKNEESARSWAPPTPDLTLAVEWPASDEARVEIRTDDGDPQLAAAVELVSPQNKDRPRSREALAAKCAGHLRRGCGVVVVDVVTTRRACLRGDLLSALGVEWSGDEPETLTATAYRPLGGDADGRLLVWPAALAIGERLPTMPLWLGGEVGVPLDLEASHRAACADLSIRLAG